MSQFRPYEVDVEWLDGEKRTYQCGGTLRPADAIREHEGALVLRKQNGEYATVEHVQTIPLAAVRGYHAREVNRWKA